MEKLSKDQIEVLYELRHHEYLILSKEDSTMQFQFSLHVNNQRNLLSGSSKFIFYLFVFSYMFFPLLIVPAFSLIFHDWFLLIGIIISYVSTVLTTRKIRFQFVGLLVPMVIYWFMKGFHMDDYITFYYLCAFWGGFFYLMAVSYEESAAKRILLNDEKLFNKLSIAGDIFFMRKKLD